MVAVPESIATKYNLSASEEIEHIYNTVVHDRAKEVYQVGGHQALILLGTDNEGFMPRKLETITDDQGSISVYELVHKAGHIMVG